MIANVLGDDVLSGRVTRANFYGPPILVFGDGLTSDSDPRWLAARAFAFDLGAPFGRPEVPLIGLNANSPENPPQLRDGLRRLAPFFDASSGVLPYRWSDGAAEFFDQYPCGPAFSMPSSDASRDDVRSAAGIVTEQFVRVTFGSTCGIGCFAVGPYGDPEVRATPPVYDLPATGYAKTLKAIREVWARGGPINLSSYQVLQELEGSRFGISRRVHPALVPYLFLGVA